MRPKENGCIIETEVTFGSDFRMLNDKTITDAYPLSDITQIFDQVGGHKYCTVLDLASGFHQILMDPRDTHENYFQYTIMVIMSMFE